jgi:uncharacterized phage infection (PIP) family protein YhgE
MSIASEIRSYADNAVTQGKHVLDQAQAQLNDVTGQANELYGKTRENVSQFATKAGHAVTDLRASAEKAINLEAIKTAVEPYLTQVKDYRATVTEHAENLVSSVKKDKRVVKLVDTVQERVVQPVRTLTGRGAHAAGKPAAKPAPTAAAAKPATKPAATKPATRPTATKPAARKVPARRASR